MASMFHQKIRSLQGKRDRRDMIEDLTDRRKRIDKEIDSIRRDRERKKKK